MFTLKHVENHKSYGYMVSFALITTSALKNAMLRTHIGSCMLMDCVIILFAIYVCLIKLAVCPAKEEILKDTCPAT